MIPEKNPPAIHLDLVKGMHLSKFQQGTDFLDGVGTGDGTLPGKK
jgi:hypothetical protein